jgi:TonB-linked SusC/RagA family outer membrane protein
MITLYKFLFRQLRWGLLTVVLMSNFALAQNTGLTVSGTVTDDKGLSLPGVTIVQKPGTNGTQTDLHGNFTLTNVSANTKLQVSFVGYETQYLPVNGRTRLTIALVSSQKTLGEIVVVGYGTQRKAATTGAIATVKADELTQTPITNIAQGLQARVSGVEITQNSAAPGGNISVRIRGVNSINGSSEPLYVIDGIQVTNSGGIADVSPLSTINPDDIASIDILKDASSTAIYGSRGANGVVLITTKRGKNGATRVSLDSYFGEQKVTKTLKMMNASEFAAEENDVYNRTIFADPAAEGQGTNWQSLIFRTAPIQNYQLGINGGDEKTQISISGNFMQQEGIVINSDFTRYSLRVNVDHKISNRVKIGTSIFSSYSIDNAIPNGSTSLDAAEYTTSVVGAALAAPPTLQPYDANGKFYPFSSQFNGFYAESANPLAIAMIKNSTSIKRTLANAYVEVNILPGLTYRGSFNTDLQNSLEDYYSPRSIVATADLNSTSGSASKTNSNSLLLLHESVLTYEKKFNADHYLKITGVYATQNSLFNTNTASANGFPNDVTEDEALQLGLAPSVSSNRTSSRLDSYMGRINYGYKDKYFLDLTAREDGASVFGANHKYGFFPAIAASWRIIEEPFLKDQTLLSDLKLRASYGITGNAGAIGPYQSLSLVGPSPNFNYEFNGTYNVGIAPNGIANPDLKWEQSAQTNIGLDIAFDKNRFTFIADAYDKTTSGLIYSELLPLSSGYSSITGNFAKISNKGLEFAASAKILTGALKWNVNGNISFNRNKVLSIVGGVNEAFVSPYSVVQVGQPLGVFKTYVYDGIYQTGETILPGSGSKTGGTKVKDLNGDGQITSADQTITGNPNPNFIYGFSSNLSYGRFDFSAFFSGTQGNDIYNVARYTFENPNGGKNVFAAVTDRWSPTNPGADYVSAVGNQGNRLPISNRFIEDGSYLRCKNITLGYHLPKIKGVYNARVYVSANNLFTVTKYSGYDPEVNTYAGSNTVLGVDNIVYPQAKSFLAGLQVTF